MTINLNRQFTEKDFAGIDMFPSRYKHQVLIPECKKVKDEVRATGAQRTQNIQSGYNAKINSTAYPGNDISQKTDEGVGFLLGIGFSIALMGLIGNLGCSIFKMSHCMGFFSGAIVIGIVIMVIGGITYAVAKKNLSEKLSQYNAAQTRNADILNQMNKAVGAENEKLDQEIRAVEMYFTRAFKKYSEVYEQMVQRRSQQLANSPLAAETSKSITEYMINKINAADRRPQTLQVCARVTFSVHNDCIFTDNTKYSFVENRRSNLTSDVDMAALCRTLASAVRLAVTMKYPQDITGTPAKVTVSYTDDATAVIEYTANNGYYQPVQKW